MNLNTDCIHIKKVLPYVRKMAKGLSHSFRLGLGTVSNKVWVYKWVPLLGHKEIVHELFVTCILQNGNMGCHLPTTFSAHNGDHSHQLSLALTQQLHGQLLSNCQHSFGPRAENCSWECIHAPGLHCALDSMWKI